MGAVDGGMAVRKAAAVFKVSVTYIYKALTPRLLTGFIRGNPVPGRPPRRLSPEKELGLSAHIRSRLSIILAQEQSWLEAELGLTVSIGAMGNAARHLGCLPKKALRASEQDQCDVAARRKLWRAAQPFIGPESRVFLDEAGVNVKIARLYGWAPVDERCHDSAPFGYRKTMTFIAGLRLTGIIVP